MADLDLLKSVEKAGLLTQADHDANFTAIETVVNAKQDKLDPTQTTATAITIDDTKADQDLALTAASAVTITLSTGTSGTSDNKSGAISEGPQTATVVVAAGAQYYLERDDYTAAGRTASFEIRGSITWEVLRIDSNNRRYLIKGGTNHNQDLRDLIVFGYRSPYEELTGAQTLNGATAPEGCTRAHTGTAVFWTLPSRITSAAASLECLSIVVHNFGSGLITFTAAGPTLVGNSSLAIGESATIEWMRKGTGIERVVVRATA